MWRWDSTSRASIWAVSATKPGRPQPLMANSRVRAPCKQGCFVEAAVGQNDRYGDLGELEIQAACDMRTGQAQGGAVAWSVFDAGAQ
jgi:hypothetical protein